MKKRQLTVRVVRPNDWDEEAFKEHVAKVIFEMWKQVCPKELQLAVIENTLKKMNG